MSHRLDSKPKPKPTDHARPRLSELSYFATGGNARHLACPQSSQDLQAALAQCKQDGLISFFLGGGSNSLVMDRDWPGMVISFHQLKHLRIDASTGIVVAGAGVENSRLTEAVWQAGLCGLAWMHRLPGQIGGTTRMNARCYGGEISQNVKRVRTVDVNGELKDYDVDKTRVFRGYKDTYFMDQKEAIAEVELHLTPAQGDQLAQARQQMEFCQNDRTAKLQFEHPTCGCVFKNDYSVGIASGFLLEHAGGKALSRPGATINPKHANFVFNQGGGSDTLLELTFDMRELVYAEFGVWLEYEMEILGQLSPEQKARFSEQRRQDPSKASRLNEVLKLWQNRANTRKT